MSVERCRILDRNPVMVLEKRIEIGHWTKVAIKVSFINLRVCYICPLPS